MQNENENKQETKKTRFAGKGYYIALIACIAAVGISGYVFVKTVRDSAVETSGTVTISPAVSQEAESAVSEAPKSAAKTKDAKDSKDKETAAAPTTSASAAKEADRMEDAYEATMGTAGTSIQWPLDGDVAATFSQDTLTYSQTMADWRTHEGLDISAAADTNVCATQNGTVTAVYEDDFLGNVVVVSHSGDLATLYANLSAEPAVQVGDTVKAGQTLGQVGNSALLETAEPSHLHFEVYENGAAVDPLEYLPG